MAHRKGGTYKLQVNNLLNCSFISEETWVYDLLKKYRLNFHCNFAVIKHFDCDSIHDVF